ASIADLVCPFGTRRIADHVATLQLTITVSGTHDDRAVDHEQPLVDVLIVVWERFARFEIVEVHRRLRRSQNAADVQATGEVLEEIHLRRLVLSGHASKTSKWLKVVPPGPR